MYGALSIANAAVLQAKSVEFVGFVEAYTLTASQGRLRELDDNFQHIFSAENSTGFLLASHQNRTCFISHRDCAGKVCVCKDLAERYLCPPEGHPQLDDDMKEFLLSQTNPTPILAILVDDGSTKVVTHYSQSDLAIEEIPAGCCFTIRDCFLSECDPDSMKIVQEFATTNPLVEEDLQAASLKATISIRDRIEYWPKPTGLGMTLWKDSCQSVITITNPIGNDYKPDEVVAKITKPKKAITPFNFYSKLLSEQKNDDTSMPAKKKSSVLKGQTWRKMSAAEKLPYLEHAEEDKKRYEEEMKEYHRQLGIANPSKRATVAYNLFVHHEKQVLAGYEFEKDKTRVGKHCGDRWRNMSKEEQDMYRALKDVWDSTSAANVNAMDE